MGGRVQTGVGLGRMGLIGVGVLALGLVTPACGKTGRRDMPDFVGDAGASPVEVGGSSFGGPTSGGESPGGTETVGGSISVGGPGGEAGVPIEGGAGGGPPGPRRPITARIVDPVVGAVGGMKIYIAGKTFVSDANGIVDATAPFGEYDVLVLDTNADLDVTSEWTRGLHVYQGITTPTPVFTLFRDYDPEMHKSTATGALTGSYSADLVGGVGFDARSPQLAWLDRKVTAGAYNATSLWFDGDASADGNLLALFWSLDADYQPAAFWFGQTAVQWGPSLPPIAADIALAALPSRELTLQVNLSARTHAYAGIFTGPGERGDDPFSFAWSAGQDDAINATTHLVPKEPLPNPALRTSVELVFSQDLTDTLLPTATVVTRIPADATILTLEDPGLFTLLKPVAQAKGVAADAKFTFEAAPNTCHEIRVDIASPSPQAGWHYKVTIHTARAEFTPPDLGPSGPLWPIAGYGRWTVYSSGPCASADDLVTLSEVAHDTSTRFSLGSRTFTTAQ